MKPSGQKEDTSSRAPRRVKVAEAIYLVSPQLVDREVKVYPTLSQAFRLLENDWEIQALLRMSNIMAVNRLGYNDHGPVHSRIVAGSSLIIHRLLQQGGIEFSIIKDGIGSIEDSLLVTLMGAYLHDVGNAVHRVHHNLHGCFLAAPILDRILSKLYKDSTKRTLLKQEILHVIFSHDEDVMTLSIEAGIVKVADGTDMAEGRARMPFRKGKVDIHSLSALAIKSVKITKGDAKPIRIIVEMENEAGVFQIEEVLAKKIRTSSIGRFLEVVALKDGLEIKYYDF
ncbi:MAG: phosphohydrolase [Thermoprotei archaeon]|nr:MAG: phosphohydrolase [Thermoprotei archaeon]